MRKEEPFDFQICLIANSLIMQLKKVRSEDMRFSATNKLDRAVLLKSSQRVFETNVVSR